MRTTEVLCLSRSQLHVAVLCSLLQLSLTACRDGERTETQRADTITPAAVTPPRADRRPGLRFDPAALQPGTAVGELVTDSVAAHPSAIGSTYVGLARFRGQIDVSGWTHLHPDTDAADVASCFEADSASANRLPRWLGDERRPGFCFENPVDAVRALGPPSGGAGVPATIVIERYTIHVGHSDKVNTARFVRRLARCYRSPHSVLSGPPTRSGQQGQAPGWLRLEGRATAERGQAELVDADRKWLGALWRRASNDSVSVSALSDHLRVELRLIVSDSVAVGPAVARSDAAAERDETGRLVDFRRAWELRAVRASCDSMPVPLR
jgi:hypothetical protein